MCFYYSVTFKLLFFIMSCRVAGHPLAQNEKCLHMFIQEQVIDRNYVPGKIRNTWAAAPFLSSSTLCSTIFLFLSVFSLTVFSVLRYAHLSLSFWLLVLCFYPTTLYWVFMCPPDPFICFSCLISLHICLETALHCCSSFLISVCPSHSTFSQFILRPVSLLLVYHVMFPSFFVVSC